MKGIGNDDQISFIEVNYQKPSEYIKFYEEEFNIWGKVKRKEGFYKDLGYGLERIDNIPFGMVVNNKTMIVKAHINVEFSNGRVKTIYFNTDEEMNLFLKREFQGKNWRIFD